MQACTQNAISMITEETVHSDSLNWLQSGVKVSWRASSEKLLLPSSSWIPLKFFERNRRAHFCPQKPLLLVWPKAHRKKKKKSKIQQRRNLYCMPLGDYSMTPDNRESVQRGYSAQETYACAGVLDGRTCASLHKTSNSLKYSLIRRWSLSSSESACLLSCIRW